MEKVKKVFKNNEIISYLIIGFLTTLVSLLVYYILVSTIFNPNIAIELQIVNVLSWIISVTFAYFTNRKYVFNINSKSNLKECIKFYLSRIFTLVLDMLFMFILVSLLKFNDKLIKIIVQFIVIVINYLLSKFIIFKK